MLESRLTHSLIAKLRQYSSLVVHELRAAGKECCKHAGLRMGMCETLMPDVMVPEALQNNCRDPQKSNSNYFMTTRSGRSFKPNAEMAKDDGGSEGVSELVRMLLEDHRL